MTRQTHKGSIPLKFVCEHGDFFALFGGDLMAYPQDASGCTGMLFMRVPHGGKRPCRECGAGPGRCHLLYCGKEPCPHRDCGRPLLGCLARKHGITDMDEFRRTIGMPEFGLRGRASLNTADCQD